MIQTLKITFNVENLINKLANTRRGKLFFSLPLINDESIKKLTTEFSCIELLQMPDIIKSLMKIINILTNY